MCFISLADRQIRWNEISFGNGHDDGFDGKELHVTLSY